MTAHIIWFIVSAVIVIGAGIVLSRTADGIAEGTGFGRLAVGAVLLAGATTLPEIMTDLAAIRLGAPDLAVGDILGSCLMNLAILALLDMAHRARHREPLVTRLVVGQTRAATLSLVMLGVVGLAIQTRVGLNLAGVGFGTILAALIYLTSLRIAIRQGEAPAEAPPTLPASPAPGMSLRLAVLGFALGAVAVALAGPRLAASGEAIATATGLGETFFGTVFLAFVTSLPELVASFTALRLGAYDLAVGNIFGSNAFNVAVLVIFDIAHREGPLLAAVSQSHLVTVLVVVVVTGLAIQSILTKDERRLWIWERDAVTMILAILAGIGVIYAAR
jgi:cation:H+ antiporter